MGVTIVKGGMLVTPEGRVEADVLARDGIIQAIGRDLAMPADAEVIDVAGLAVLPGIIDCHSHLWELGFMSRDDFEDSTASAAAGGITTVIDMPLTTPEVLDRPSFRTKVALGEKTSHTDFALHGGVSPDRFDHLEEQWREGATAFKIFTCDTGCAMRGVIDDADLVEAMTRIARFDGLAIFHAENEELLVANKRRLLAAGRRDNAAFSEWRSELVELEAINRILFYAERLGTRVNIVHVTSPNGIALIEAARGRGVRATGETCPHYLYLTEEDMLRDGLWAMCAPPVRGADARAGLRAMVASGAVTTIGSDHGPVDPDLKRRGDNDIFAGQFGLPGNETMVPLLLNLVAEGVFPLERLAAVASEAPARLYGLYPRKGAIRIGSDADFTIVDAAARWSLAAADLIGKSGWIPYEGMAVQGRVALTVVRGRVVARDGRLAGPPGTARFIPRQAA
jgi:allantoinase